MPETAKIYDHALTSLARVKDRMNISESNLDAVLARTINGVTDLIEGECGGRRFKETQYTNQVHSIYNTSQRKLALKHYPIGSVTSLQYRTGLPSNPNWTDFNVDDWQVVEDGSSGLIEVFGLLRDTNAIRISYTAGYKINWEGAGDASTHTLPADLTDLAERLVVKIFKKRENEGRLSESFEGSTVTYGDLLDDDTKAILARYRRLPAFV